MMNVQEKFIDWRAQSIKASDDRVERNFQLLLKRKPVDKFVVTITLIMFIVALSSLTLLLMKVLPVSIIERNVVNEVKYYQQTIVVYNTTYNYTTTIQPQFVGECVSVRPVNSTEWDAKCRLV